MTQEPAARSAALQVSTSFPLGVLGLFLASGASGLMLEVIWSRMLGWLLGATTWSVMTILVTYLGGLGLGGLMWGARAGRAERPLRLFGFMEVVIGLYSLAVPLIFGALGHVFVAATRVVGEAPGAVVALRIVAAVAVLAPPTLLMGGTLAVLTRFVAPGGATAGRTAGLLYATNTAGAVLGCVLTGCFLIFWLGVIETNTLAAVIDLGVGVAALAWDRRRAPVGVEASQVVVPVVGRTTGTAALGLAVLSGFCGLAYEVLWTRGLLATMTDDTTYAFTLMLTAFLAGHALGAGWAGQSSHERDWQGLGAAQMLAALTALLSFPLLVLIRDPINRASFVEGMSFWQARVPFHLAISLAVLAPSAFFLGASFAQAARLYVGRGRAVGSSTGRLYGLNTLGAILGAIVTTVWLVPGLGVQRALVALAIVQAVAGALALLFGGASLGAIAGRVNAALALGVLVFAAYGLNLAFPLRTIYERQEPGHRLLATLEGSGATVTVHQRSSSDRVISINGVNVAGTNLVLRATQKLQAHVPVFLHRGAPRSVLQIGFGSGGTCYSVSLHPEVESIEVCELNPDVLKVASAWFRDINHGVLDDPRVHVRIDDAKSHVAVTDRTYDLILSDSTHPRFRGNASLYARDYFENCARRLRPGGLFSTWLPLYGMSVEDVRGILKSFFAVFPHVQIWYANFEPHENTLVLASREPIAVDWSAFARQLADPRVAADLAEVEIASVPQLLDFFLLGDSAVEAFSRAGKLNTDDHPRLEFLAPRTMRRKQSLMENFAALRTAREPIDRTLDGATKAQRAEMARWFEGTTSKLAGQSFELEGRAPEALEAYAACVRTNPQDRLAAVRLERLRRALEARR
jgi:spermidine synthase